MKIFLSYPITDTPFGGANQFLKVHPVRAYLANSGLATARNTGLSFANGEYVAFLDSDDYANSDAYEKMYNKALKHDADIVYCQAKYLDDNTNKMIEKCDSSALPLFNKLQNKLFNYKDLDIEKIFSYSSFVVAWNKIYKKSFLKKIAAKFKSGLIYEDNFFYFYTLFEAKKIYAIHERLIIYRINRKNSIIYNATNNTNGKSLHIISALSDIQNYILSINNKDAKKYFYRWAQNEIFYKYSLLTFRLRKNT